jgi:uncharacterized protein YndB with AHSA1/START domain
MINSSVEINRPPAEVFAYLDEVERHGEWQPDIVSTKKETEGPVGVGTRVTNIRRVPGGRRPITYEITEHEPPRRTVFRGVNGPVRPDGTVTVEPLDDGTRSRVSLQFDLVGHGLLGKLFAPMARRQAARTIPRDQQTLKQKLESGA